MKNKNGFVFLETIIVVCILSSMLVILYSSYSYILVKSEERTTFNSTEYIYRAYQIIQILKNDNGLHNDNNNSIEIKHFMQKQDYSLVFNSSNIPDSEKAILKDIYELGDISLVTPANVLCKTGVCANNLKLLRPSLVDYIKTFDENDKTEYLIFRFDIPSYKVNSNKYSTESDCNGSNPSGECLKIPHYVKFSMEEIR